MERQRHRCASVAIGRMAGPTTPLLSVCSNRPHKRRCRDAGYSEGVARSLCLSVWLGPDGQTDEHGPTAIGAVVEQPGGQRTGSALLF